MPSSYSTNLRFELQYTGENVNTWGDKLDATLSRVDDSIAGFVAITMPGTGNYTLTSTNSNTAADEARMAHLKLNGTVATNFYLYVPSVSKTYWIWNNTNKNAYVSTGAGSYVIIESGDKQPVWCDGTNVNHGYYFGGYGLKDYIAAVASGSGSMPSPVGNAGKYIYSDGVSALWRQVQTSDLGDYSTAIVGMQVALAVAL